MRVTERIQELARDRGLSAREISTRLGRSHSWLSYRYRGAQAYGLDDLEAIAGLFGVHVEELLGIGVFTAGDEFVPPDVQRLADELVGKVLPEYRRERITDGERRALVRIIREALKRVDLGIEYWRAELARTPKREPTTGAKGAPSGRRNSKGGTTDGS